MLYYSLSTGFYSALAYLFGHLSGSLMVTSSFLIVLWSTFAIIKLLSRYLRAVETCQLTDRPSIDLIMILCAVFAGILWGIGLG